MAKSQSFRLMAILLFTLVLGFGVNGMVNGGDTNLDPNSVLKTIVSGDETIDCVDINKQPAFKHPLLKNHTIQLKPSSYPTGSKSIAAVNSTKHIQIWHMNGEYCPKGTVAILRSSTADLPPKNKYDRLRPAFSKLNENGSSHLAGIPHPEFATVFLQASGYYGLNADMSAWNPKVEANESSSSQVWVTDGGRGEKIEAIEAGWIVRPSKPHPEIFIYWTVDGYGSAGCYNLDCPGFVLISSKYSLGAQVQPSSKFGGVQYLVNYQIFKDHKTGHWWLSIAGTHVGYWPVDLFRNLQASANLLEWGGRVVNTYPKGIHTSTQMGSGSPPRAGYRKAAWFAHLQYIDGQGNFNPVNSDDIDSHASRPECYNVELQDWKKEFGVYFLYGGPGFSPAHPGYSPACQ